MRRIGAALLALWLSGCGSAVLPGDSVPSVAELRLGMTPEEVVKAAGVPDRQTSLGRGEGMIDITWTYRKNHHLVLKDEAGDQDFPKGAILIFGVNGRKLTQVLTPEIPASRAVPGAEPPVRPPPAQPMPPAPLEALRPEEAKASVERVMTGPEAGLQNEVDRIILRFGDCLPFLVVALDGEDKPLPEGARFFLPALPGQPADRMRKVRPATRMALVLNLLNQGTGQHFGSPEKAGDLPAIAAKWKEWFAAQASKP